VSVTFALATCWVVLLLLGLASAANGATVVHSYKPLGAPPFGVEPFNADGSGSSELAVSSGTGDIFIPEHNQGFVTAFAPDAFLGGTFLTRFEPYGFAGIDPQNIAVDSGDDTLYVADNNFISFGIAKLLSDGQPTPTYTYDPSFAPDIASFQAIGAMAVDPGSGDLFVVDPTANRVVKLAAADGHELLSVSGFQGARFVAAGPSGEFYVTDWAGKNVKRFAADGTPQGNLPLPSGAIPSAITTDPLTGEVAVVVMLHREIFIDGFAADGASEFSARVSSSIEIAPGGSVTGIAWDGSSGRIYVSTIVQGQPGKVATFVPALQPGVDAPLATTGRNTAHVSAEVASEGDDTSARLEYCLSTEACGEYPVPTPGDPANPWKRGPEHEHLTATEQIEDDLPLGSNATWLVRVSANDTVEGTENTSAITTVDSPLLTPGATTGAAASITESQAELNGTVDTLAAQATYHFEYGLTAGYGSRVPVSTEAAAGDNRTPRAVSQLIQGLQPGTTYHYRLVARNSVGENVGADRTFTAAGVNEFPERVYEQVTPVDKGGAQMASDYHTQIAADGSWIAVAAASASASDVGSRMRQNSLIRRGSSDWDDWIPIEAPQNAAPGLFESSTAGLSADGEHALVISNRSLAPGGIEGGGNLYVKDLRTGAYTFVAGAPGNGAYQNLADLQANENIYLASAPDMSWLLFYTKVPVAPGAPNKAMYRWTRSGGLSIESWIPNPFEPGSEMIAPETQMAGYYKTTYPSASQDGTIVAFGTSGGVVRRAGGVSEVVSVSHVAGELGFQYPATFDGITPDGRYVFFHSAVHLTEDTPADLSGREAEYRYDADTGALIFTTRVAPSPDSVYGIGEDGRSLYADNGAGIVAWHAGDQRVITTDALTSTSLKARTYTSQNGRYFAWIGHAPSGDTEEAFLYDGDTGQTACASCPADGSEGKGAHFTANSRQIGNTVPRAVTDDGTFFFDTAARLTSADHNGSRDVYAYRNGRVSLISPGDERFDATFVGASADGRDVFFQTDQSLVSRDVDRSTDVYDARVGGGFAAQNPSPAMAPCVRSACTEASSGPVTSPPVRGSLPAGKHAAKAPAISLGKVNFSGRSLLIRIHASGPGRVRVSGAGVKTTARKVKRAGSYSIGVPLNSRARARLKAGKKVKVSVTVSLSADGGSASAKYSRTIGK